MEALAQSSSSKRCPPSFTLRQAGRLPRVRKTLPRPYRTPSQDALWPDISSRGTGGPLLVPGDGAHFLSPWEPASAQRWPVQPSPSRSCTTGAGGRGGEWELWHHFITSPEAPFLPATANKASWAQGPSQGVLRLPNPPQCTDLMGHSFNTSLGGSTQSAN